MTTVMSPEPVKDTCQYFSECNEIANAGNRCVKDEHAREVLGIKK